MEIIIVNDGSTDKTKEIIENNLKYIDVAKHLNKNFGKGRAVIEGLNISKNEYIYFQDADLEYSPSNIISFLYCFFYNSE